MKAEWRSVVLSVRSTLLLRNEMVNFDSDRLADTAAIILTAFFDGLRNCHRCPPQLDLLDERGVVLQVGH
jgi:hypothetical protein